MRLDLLVGEAVEDRRGGTPGVAVDADRDLLDQPEHANVAVDLDDLGVLGPVVDAVLRQSAERPQPGAQRQHHVGLGDDAHRGLGALIAERTAGQLVAGRERIVVEIAGDDRRRQPLRERPRLGDAVGHDHAAAGDDHGELRRGERLRRLLEALRAAGRAFDLLRLWNGDVHLAVEIVARDIDLCWPALGQRDVEGAVGQLGKPVGPVHMHLVLGDLLEERHLLGLLEAAEANRAAARLRRDRDHRRMRPVGGRDRGHEIGDAGPVLGDADAVAVGHARIAVGHVGRVLLVRDADEADARRREDVERVHVGGADDAEHVFTPLAARVSTKASLLVIRVMAVLPAVCVPAAEGADLCSKRNDCAHF